MGYAVRSPTNTVLANTQRHISAQNSSCACAIFFQLYQAVPLPHLGRWHVCKRKEEQFLFNKLVHHPNFSQEVRNVLNAPDFLTGGMEESDRRCDLREVRTSQHCISFVDIQRHFID